MDDYRLHLQAGGPGDAPWFWRLDDAAGFQLAAGWADSVAAALDAVKVEAARLGLDPRAGG